MPASRAMVPAACAAAGQASGGNLDRSNRIRLLPMAVQRADPEYDRPRQRWWNRGSAPHAANHVASHDVNHDVSHASGHAVGHDVSHAPGHVVSSPVSSGASHARSPARKPARKPVRIGDAIVHPDIDGLPVPGPDEYAREFVSFLQAHPALQDLLGGWISSGALERQYYRQFGATIGKWPLLPWRMGCRRAWRPLGKAG